MINRKCGWFSVTLYVNYNIMSFCCHLSSQCQLLYSECEAVIQWNNLIDVIGIIAMKGRMFVQGKHLCRYELWLNTVVVSQDQVLILLILVHGTVGTTGIYSVHSLRYCLVLPGELQSAPVSVSRIMTLNICWLCCTLHPVTITWLSVECPWYVDD